MEQKLIQQGWSVPAPGSRIAPLSRALRGSGSFRYVCEVVGERDAVLEFLVEIDGVSVNGADMIRWNDAGKIVDFKVMLRPMKALRVMHQRIAAILQGPT